MSKVRVEVGDVYKLTSGRDAVIVELLPKARCIIKIVGTEFFQNCQRFTLKNGRVKDNYYPIVAGFGYFGDGRFRASLNGRSTREYSLWAGMLERVYIKCFTSTPSYMNVTICDEWHNFQNFAKWCNEQPEFFYKQKWYLDKDIHYFYNLKHNVEYSPKTCYFVPRVINNTFSLREADRSELPLGISPQGSKFYARVQFKNKSIRSPIFTEIQDAVDWYYATKNNCIKLLAKEYKEKLNPICYQMLMQLEVKDPLLFETV